ncbi:hypothetical protein CHISP_1215 [Chitinispirillum alkaliphilum]|nr:hypothetical protein CHISP_1215 [Chitinispirillum alkaliphilum]
MIQKCTHPSLKCLNQYDLIRKYQCEFCKEVMMCSCDKEHGERFLPYQLHFGTWYGSREKVAVTLGFQHNTCPECRGEKPEAAPKAPVHGATSKIVRYYWREIFFETTRRFYDSHPEINPNSFSEFSFPEERKLIEKQVIEKIKKVHEISPKYHYNELSQSEVISQTNTEVILVKAEHIKNEGKKVGIQDGNDIVTVEEFASRYFKNLGFSVMHVESVPFHVLFGVFMFLVIQDVGDEKGRLVQFGSRNDFDSDRSEEGRISTILPDDFGSKLYYERQRELISRHIDKLDDLEWLFDYWLGHSSGLRQYLWAHRDSDVAKAKEVMRVLGLENLKKVLHYLSMDYWKNFCGWPDLLIHNDCEIRFVEVKSKNDKLSEDQKNWFLGNHAHMGFNATIFKVQQSKKA